MKAHAIIVLGDGETWSMVEGSSIVVITDEELEHLINGDLAPRHLQPLVELSLQDLTPKTEN